MKGKEQEYYDKKFGNTSTSAPPRKSSFRKREKTDQTTSPTKESIVKESQPQEDIQQEDNQQVYIRQDDIQPPFDVNDSVGEKIEERPPQEDIPKTDNELVKENEITQPPTNKPVVISSPNRKTTKKRILFTPPKIPIISNEVPNNSTPPKIPIISNEVPNNSTPPSTTETLKIDNTTEGLNTPPMSNNSISVKPNTVDEEQKVEETNNSMETPPQPLTDNSKDAPPITPNDGNLNTEKNEPPTHIPLISPTNSPTKKTTPSPSNRRAKKKGRRYVSVTGETVDTSKIGKKTNEEDQQQDETDD